MVYTCGTPYTGLPLWWSSPSPSNEIDPGAVAWRISSSGASGLSHAEVSISVRATTTIRCVAHSFLSRDTSGSGETEPQPPAPRPTGMGEWWNGRTGSRDSDRRDRSRATVPGDMDCRPLVRGQRGGWIQTRIHPPLVIRPDGAGQSPGTASGAKSLAARRFSTRRSSRAPPVIRAFSQLPKSSK
jgi:hypothetical protein